MQQLTESAGLINDAVPATSVGRLFTDKPEVGRGNSVSQLFEFVTLKMTSDCCLEVAEGAVRDMEHWVDEFDRVVSHGR